MILSNKRLLTSVFKWFLFIILMYCTTSVFNISTTISCVFYQLQNRLILILANSKDFKVRTTQNISFTRHRQLLLYLTEVGYSINLESSVAFLKHLLYMPLFTQIQFHMKSIDRGALFCFTIKEISIFTYAIQHVHIDQSHLPS